MPSASGAHFGFRANAAHLAGVAAGFCAMIAAVGLGLGGVFRSFPALRKILALAGGG